MKTDFLVIGSGAAGTLVRAEGRGPRSRDNRDQRRDERMQYQLRPGRHLFGYLRPRHLRETHPRHARLRGRQVRPRSGRTRRAAGPS